MLVIRQQQLHALGALPRSNFERRVLEHFERFYPREAELAGRASMLQFVKLGIRRAVNHGYNTRRDVTLYVNLMVMLGCDFDRDPQIPWAGAKVTDRSCPFLFKRIHRTFHAALDYLGRTSGDNNHGIAKAMLRIRDFRFDEDSPSSTGAELERDLHALLQKFYPEKYAVQGKAPNREIVSLGMFSARRLGYESGQGATLITTLMFMLGSGFAHDPMYPWASRVLGDESLKGESAKIQALYTEAMAYLNASLREYPISAE